jgi:hypothetical protein
MCSSYMCASSFAVLLLMLFTTYGMCFSSCNSGCWFLFKSSLASRPTGICILTLLGCCGVGVQHLQCLTGRASCAADSGTAMSDDPEATPHLMAVRISDCTGMPLKKGLLGFGKVPWKLRVLINNCIVGTSQPSWSVQVRAEKLVKKCPMTHQTFET